MTRWEYKVLPVDGNGYIAHPDFLVGVDSTFVDGDGDRFVSAVSRYSLTLNDLGEDGWELVAVTPHIDGIDRAFFKRAVLQVVSGAQS